MRREAAYFWEDVKSGEVRDRIYATGKAGLGIGAGLAQGYVTIKTGGAAGAFVGLHGVGNLAGGVGDYLNILDGGDRNWNVTRQGYENIFEYAGQSPSSGATAFHLTDAATGAGILLSPVQIHKVRQFGVAGSVEHYYRVPSVLVTPPPILLHDAVQIGTGLYEGLD